MIENDFQTALHHGGTTTSPVSYINNHKEEVHLLHSAHVLNYVFRMPVPYLEHIRTSKLHGLTLLTLCG